MRYLFGGLNRLAILASLTACFTLADGESAPPQFDWAGHMIRLDLGGAVNFESWSQETGFVSNIEPFLELGYEYAFVIKEALYLSGGLSWTITVPRNFKPSTGFFDPPTALWYTPMSYLQVGYVFPNKILLTGGLVYFWGFLATLRFPLSDHFFFETKGILWLDRIFDTGGFFGKGFDNVHGTLGVAYHF